MESLQSRRILLCDRFGLSTDREFGRVKKKIPRERLMRSFGSRFFKKKKPVLQAEIFSFFFFFFFFFARPTDSKRRGDGKRNILWGWPKTN